MTRVMGIDPSIKKSGFGILDIDNDVQLVDYDVCKSDGNVKDIEHLIPKIRDLHLFTSDKLIKYKPDIIIIERPPVKGFGVQYVSYAVGCMMNTISIYADDEKTVHDRDIKFYFLTATQWRKKVYGKFNQSFNKKNAKAVSKKLVNELFDIKVSDDIAEGILIAYSYITIYNEEQYDLFKK